MFYIKYPLWKIKLSFLYVRSCIYLFSIVDITTAIKQNVCNMATTGKERDKRCGCIWEKKEHCMTTKKKQEKTLF